MATFNREKFKALNPGVTDAQIDAYLSSPQAKIDSSAPPPQQMGMGPPFPSPVPGGGNPLAGAAGAAMESLSGLRGIGLGVGGLGAILGGKALVGKIMRGAQKAPPPIAAASEATSVARGPVTVTQEMINRLPLLKHFNVGDEIDPKDLNRIRIKSAEAEMRTAPRGKPNLKLVPPSEAGPASLEATVTPETMTQPAPAPSRHEIEYYNKGQKKFVPIESMSNNELLAAKTDMTTKGKGSIGNKQLDSINQEIALRVQGTPEVPPGHYLSESKGVLPIKEIHISHMRNAMNKAWAKLQANPTDASLQRQFNDIKNEVTLRAQQAGELSVPEELASVSRNFRPSMGAGPVGQMNEVAMILSMLQAPQQMAETDALMNQVRQQEAQRNQTSPALLRALFGNQSQGY